MKPLTNAQITLLQGAAHNPEGRVPMSYTQPSTLDILKDRGYIELRPTHGPVDATKEAFANALAEAAARARDGEHDKAWFDLKQWFYYRPRWEERIYYITDAGRAVLKTKEAGTDAAGSV